MLAWDAPTQRYFHHGVDRGVIYISGENPVVWNGLISVDEQGGGGSEILYRDGRIILADIDASDFEASVTAFFFPDEFSKCLGMPEAAENLYIDNQKPKRFGMSYRSLIGSGVTGDMFGYQIHLVYNCLASMGRRQRKTLSDNPEPMTFDFGIVCTPIKLAGFRPTAHYILDTRGMNLGQREDLEGILYGEGAVVGRLPTSTELFELMNFGVIMKVDDNDDGTVKIIGATQYITENPDGTATITNLNAATVGDDYAISDGGNTVIVP